MVLAPNISHRLTPLPNRPRTDGKATSWPVVKTGKTVICVHFVMNCSSNLLYQLHAALYCKSPAQFLICFSPTMTASISIAA
jgi:hypothetical protein